MAVDVESLSQMPFFSRLGEDALRRVALQVQKRTFSPGQLIVLEGESCGSVYLVAKGLVRVRRLSPDGREQVLAYLGPGGSFNLVPALDGGPNLATTDSVREATLYAIPCQTLRQMVREHQEMALAISEHLAAEVRRLSDMVELLALHTVRSRLARFLLTTAQDADSPRPWTQQDIAAHIGTVREMVGRSLRAFSEEGWIRRQRGRIIILDRQGLEHEAIGV
ncbi:MAG: Crp/Fnr family transcriptional regulator [Anaerolineales bacterium]|jgi:CRP-like cAMP-binding protein|nr:MAG: Crp/Fnr family transcriptional regulator [Anaerolineales bacterium]